MALIVVFVMLTIAIAAIMTFGDAAPLRSFSRFRRFRRARKQAVRPPVAWTEPAAALPALQTISSFGAADAESVLVTLLLAGRLSQRDYQQQMAQLAAEESARGARP